ncbi:MAG TPA: hypothetical protein VKC90_07785 [Chitinophagaceae bacterium]|nr:hypothetical protein [Chitinophagaceae bacterium]
MTTEVLRQKTGRYLCGLSMPAEKRQIQTWLSCTTDNKPDVSSEEREMIENEIVAQVQAYVASTLFYPQPEPWWKKITAFF